MTQHNDVKNSGSAVDEPTADPVNEPGQTTKLYAKLADGAHAMSAHQIHWHPGVQR